MTYQAPADDPGRTPDEPPAFDRLLLTHRRVAGLTQSELATASGVSVRAISELETGRSRAPQHRSAQALAGALGLAPAAREVFLRAAGAGRARRRGAPPARPAAPLRATRGRPAGPTPPAAPADFTGRRAELRRLHALVAGLEAAPGGPAAVVVTHGPSGLGKTSLALRLAAESAASFPDGVLHLDLCGAGTWPLAAEEALARLLEALGVPADRLPRDQAERVALYRSLLHDRRLLLILDSAHDEGQVRPLLPGSPGSLTLLTSRRSLAGLEVSERLPLDVLPEADAVELLGRLAGTGAEAGADDLAELAALCGHLPLALRIAGNRLAGRRGETPSALAEQLRDEARRLDGLADGDLQVRSAFQHSYRRLPEQARRLFRRLSLVPGHDFGRGTAAALTGLPETTAEELLEALVDCGLLEPAQQAFRYRFHDLVRLFAGESLERDETPAEQRRTRTEFMIWLLETATRSGHRFDPPSSGPARPAAPDEWSRALRWLDTERANWLAAARWAAELGQHRRVVDLAEAMHWFADLRSTLSSWSELFELAAGSARALGSRREEATMLNYLSWTLSLCAGRHQEAVTVAGRAAMSARLAGDLLAEAWSLTYRATALRRLGMLVEAAVEYRSSAALMAEAGYPTGRWVARRHLGTTLRALGHSEEAAGIHREVVDQYESGHGDPPGSVHQTAALALALRELGEDEMALGHWERAATAYERVVPLLRSLQSRSTLAQSQLALGRVRFELGRPDVLDCLDPALAYFEQSPDLTAQASALRELRRSLEQLRPSSALRDQWARALELCRT
ncbi:ATP-binding protein [Kitasatospora sp. NPDC052896]|uniref:ATP-binding protein n=1 Tax=Kitasatospora sp. NPDC052896 TaxID=3364061 RepID=UPI0037CAE2C6